MSYVDSEYTRQETLGAEPLRQMYSSDKEWQGGQCGWDQRAWGRLIGDDVIRSSMDLGRYINFILSGVKNPLFFGF